MTTNPSLEDRAEKLETHVSELVHSVKTMSRAVGVISSSQRRTRRITIGLIVSVLIDIALTFFGGYLYVQVDANSERASTNSERIGNLQRIANDDVLCPLYNLLNQAVAQGPPPDSTPEEVEEFERAAVVIERGYKALECKPE